MMGPSLDLCAWGVPPHLAGLLLTPYSLLPSQPPRAQERDLPVQASPLGHPLPPALAVGLLSGWTLDPGAGTACGGLGVADVGYETVSLKGQEPGEGPKGGHLGAPVGWVLAAGRGTQRVLGGEGDAELPAGSSPRLGSAACPAVSGSQGHLVHTLSGRLSPWGARAWEGGVFSWGG